jgi:sulfite reductase (ferredoxin)
MGIVLEKKAAFADTAKIALALISLFTQKGQRKNKRTARLRHLKEKIGTEELVRLYTASLSRFENEPPLEISHRSVVDLTGKTLADTTTYWKQGSEKGTYQLSLHPTLGILNGTRVVALAALAKQAHAAIHLSHLQSVGLHGVKGEYLQTLQTSLNDIQPEWSSPALQKQPVACAGTSVCKQGMCNSRAMHTAITTEFTTSNVPLPPDWPRIRISGCPNSCAAHQIAHLGLQGGARRIGGQLVPVYDIFFRNTDASSEGELSLGASIGYLPAQAVPGFLVHLAKLMIMSGLALDQILKRELAVYRQRHVNFDRSELYRDIGECTAFSLDDRSKGECSIGIIDIIEADLRAAEAYCMDAERGDNESMFNATLAAARSLLITRGESCTDSIAVAEAFIAHFIDTGLVDSGFTPLLRRSTRLGDFQASVDSGEIQLQHIERFVETVRALYKRMDSHFNFADAVSTQTAPTEESAQQSVELDLSGVACPMNFVKAKLALEKLPVGATLRVILDDGAPIKNVPASFRSQGQHVTEVKSLGNAANLLVVERAR